MKRKLITLLLCVAWLLLSVSCSTSSALINEFPDEEIAGVVRVVVNERGEEEELALSEEKISLFFEYSEDLEYKKDYNIFGIKSREYDSVRYIVIYDSYTVKFSEHYFLVLHNGETEKEISFDSLQPSDIFDKIDSLFE